MQHTELQYLLRRLLPRISFQNTPSGHPSAPCVYIICPSWRPWLVAPFRLLPMCHTNREIKGLARRRLLLFCKHCLEFGFLVPDSELTIWRGGGVAGITAAVSWLLLWIISFLTNTSQQALSNASVHDFVILEYRDTIGGRAWHKPFGKDPKTGKPYTIEMGANWVCWTPLKVTLSH